MARNRRTLLAKIALLVEMPTPRSVQFEDDDASVRVVLDCVADGVKWASFLGRRDAHGRLNSQDGNTYLQAYPSMAWDGWTVHLWAVDHGRPDEPLEDGQRPALEAMTGE